MLDAEGQRDSGSQTGFCSPGVHAPTSHILFSVQGVPVGLNNLGNTCYVNAALQCLNSIHAFREAIFGGLEGAGNAGNPIIHETRCR